MDNVQGQLSNMIFKNRQNIINLIEQKGYHNFYISHLGIQAEPKTTFIFNGNQIEVGITGIYEITNTHINSLYFLKDESNVIIDYIITFK